MRRAVLGLALLGVIACRSREPAPEPAAVPAVPAGAGPVRAPEALLAAVEAFATRVARPPLPALGDADANAPPTEAELAWITDRAAPLQARIEHARAVQAASSQVMKAYAGADLAAAEGDPRAMKDGPITLRWGASVVRQFGHLTTALVDELLPTLDPADPSYAARRGGLTKMGVGTAQMLQGALITLNARRADLDSRRRLAAAWRDHATTFARVWTQAQCDKVRGWVGEVRGAERDAEIRAALDHLKAAFARCAPPP